MAPPEPNGPTGPAGPVVRRAVPLTGVAGTPGSSLRPQAGRAAGATGQPVGGGAVPPATTSVSAAEAAPQPDPAKAAAPAEARSGADVGTAAASATSAGAATTAADPDPAEEEGTTAAPAAEAGGGAGGARAGGPVAGDGDRPPGPRGRPSKKALLVAAGAAGVILVGVPFLVIGSGHHGHDDVADTGGTRTLTTATPPQPDPSGTLVGVGKDLDTPPASASPAAKPRAAGHKGTAPHIGTVPGASAEPVVHAASPAPHKDPAEAPAKAPAKPPATTRKKAAQPAPPTAEAAAKHVAAQPVGPVAAAVKKLAASSPGRHICYRAYVVGIGWQSPVCDGAVAGTTGQSRAIEAIDVAVSGTKGIAANALMQHTGWQTGHWPSVADDTDLTVGAPGGSEVMRGFGLDLGDGSVCQKAHVQNEGWHGQVCDDPSGYNFGGTLDDSLWLEAVEFTV